MSSRLRYVALAAGATLSLLAAPPTAGAQVRLDAVRVSADQGAARAAELHARGKASGDSLNRLARAAHLHEQSAALRGPSDPQTAECLREAALLRYYSGNRGAAARLMEQAAQAAAERGDVITASRAYSDAAIIQYENKQLARAWTLGVKAEALTGSPLLTDAQRQMLLQTNVQLDRSAQRVAVHRPLQR